MNIKSLKSLVGRRAVFVNKAHYPSLHRKPCTITADYGRSADALHRFAVRFDDDPKPMAAFESEIVITR